MPAKSGSSMTRSDIWTAPPSTWRTIGPCSQIENDKFMDNSSSTEIDIVCGKTVAKQATLMSTYGDRPYYFCSKNCQQSFGNDPIRYVDKSKSVGTTEGSPVLTENKESKINHYAIVAAAMVSENEVVL
jgi:YHS domain-containing protein